MTDRTIGYLKTNRPVTTPLDGSELIEMEQGGESVGGDVQDIADFIASELAAVASSGSYADLSGKPTLGTAAALDVDTSTSLGTSDVKVPSQKAVKAYADALIAAADAMVYKGAVDASSNPNYPAADAGHTYRISVAGKIGGASGLSVEIGDWIICNTDSTASGNQATVGANWNIFQANIDGAVIGPASVTDANPAVFDGTTGKLIKQLTYAAFKTALSLVKGDVGLGNVDNTSDTTKNAASVTLTNKRITARVSSNTTSSTPTPDADSFDVYELTALAAAAAFAAPTGTPTDEQVLIIRIKDNGSARALSWNAIYRSTGQTLPTTTVISKTLRIGLRYNSADSKWDCVAVAQET